jgi:hypothetical protein
MIRMLDLETHMEAISHAVEKQDFTEFQSKAHNIKGNVGWVSASRLHYAAYYIQRAFNEGDWDEMLRRYPHLVECVIEFKRFSHKLQHEMLSKLSTNFPIPQLCINHCLISVELPGQCIETDNERTISVAK